MTVSTTQSTTTTTTTQSNLPTPILYQKIFKKIYESKVGNNKNSWEYFSLGLSVYNWLTENDPAYTNSLVLDEVLDAIYEIFDIIISVLEMMKADSNLLAPIVFYANSFVKRAGIKHNQLFNLLLTSTIVTLKFWSESIQIRNSLIADIFEFPVLDINVMERRFLTGIDYNLNASQETIDTFLSKYNNSFHSRFQKIQLYKKQQQIIKYTNNNNNQICNTTETY